MMTISYGNFGTVYPTLENLIVQSKFMKKRLSLTRHWVCW